MTTKQSKQALTIIFVVTLGLLTYFIAPCQYITVTITPSMIERIYWISWHPEPEKITVGNFVMFDLIDEQTKKLMTTKVIKRVACAGGDDLEFENGDYYCNGKKIGSANGPEKPFVHHGALNRDELFLLGSRPEKSKDSRYFGLINKSKVVAIVHPLF